MKFTASEKKLFNKNKKMLLKYYPGLIEIINFDFPSNIDIFREDDQVDVLINGNRFYGVDYRRYASEQLETFIANPSYGEGGKPESTKDRTPTHEKIFSKFYKSLARADISPSLDRQRPDASTAFIFGLGLADHLYQIFIQTQCRYAVIFEPEPFFLKLSMYFTDWTSVLKLAEDRIYFLFKASPEASFNEARIILRSLNIGLQVLVYKYQHYTSTSISACRKYFDDKIHTLYDGLGFYDDEKVMTRNYLLNAYSDTWKLCTQANKGHIIGAVIVGAGPSLNNDIEWLLEHRNDFVIFSGGSALPTLLKHGIYPDFHVEIENIALNYELLEPLTREYDLSDVILVSSSTMDTKSARLFNRRLWFMREGVMVSHVFSPDQETLIWQNPTVVNTALSSALAFGFRNILLLGADFGTRDRNVHHSKGTAYESHADLKKVEFKFPDVIPANFGGQAYTNIHYINGILSMGVLLPYYRQARVFNGSDGALVQGCFPIRAKRFKSNATKMDKKSVVEWIYQKSGSIDWADKYNEDLIQFLVDEFSRYSKELLLAYKKSLSKEKKDFCLFLSRLYVNINLIEQPLSLFNPMINGSVNTFTMLQMHYWTRIPAESQLEYEKLCRRAWRDFFTIIQKDFLKFLEGIRQELPLVRPELFDDKSDTVLSKV